MPPRRPTSMDELSFTRRPPVQWLSPPILARAGAKVVLSAVLGDYLDKREMQLSLAAGVLPSPSGADEVWVDLVADSGDGFDSTYTVAWCVSQPTIQPHGLDDEAGLPRGDFVIFGGDQIYPYPSPTEYKDRFVGPYTAALPWTQPAVRPDDHHPQLLAIPGNHDWYDGLTSFMRVFAQPGWLGGRQLVQTRSYFAIDLPGQYWLWGIDIGNDAYVDVAQISYFSDAARKMAEGDRLILCTAKPSWTSVDSEPEAYRNLSFVERRLVPAYVETVLMVSGDKHYYARYESTTPGDDGERRTKITAGGGGAFLSATHDLEQRIHVPARVQPSTIAQEQPEDVKESYDLRLSYPDQDRSRRLTWRAMALGRFNPRFPIIPALFYLLLFAANSSGLRTSGTPIAGLAEGWGYADLLFGRFRSPATIIVLLVFWAILAAFFDVPKRFDGKLAQISPVVFGWIYRGVIGLGHTVAHVLVQALVVLLAIQVCDPLGGVWFIVAVAVFVALVGGALGSVVFGAYLVFALNVLGRHDTEAFSAFRHEGYKNFLRIKVTAQGVTVYPIGIDEVCRDWDADPDAADDEASHIKPKTGSISMRLIEPPFTLR